MYSDLPTLFSVDACMGKLMGPFRSIMDVHDLSFLDRLKPVLHPVEMPTTDTELVVAGFEVLSQNRAGSRRCEWIEDDKKKDKQDT